MAFDVVSYVLSKKYTDNSIKGTSGVLAGKNCTIESSTYESGINTIVFKWTADDGSVRRTTIQVRDGESGSDYGIVQSESQLPELTAEEQKMFYVVDDEAFYLWDGTTWSVQSTQIESITNSMIDALFD